MRFAVLAVIVLSLALSLHAMSALPNQLKSQDEQSSNALRFTQNDVERDDQWKQFKLKYHKTYKSVQEAERRKLIFFQNLARIELHNYRVSIGEKFTKIGVNIFTDLGVCGSCWTFSTTGALEGQLRRKTDRLVSLSEQNLLDCCGVDDRCKENNCDGGDPTVGFEWIKKNGGIDTESSYPYTGKPSDCTYDPSVNGGTVTGYEKLTEGDEDNLKIAVATIGPISVLIDGEQQSFQDYTKYSGVYDEPACNKTADNHAVLLVGYGTFKATGQDYWLVKNSWGVGWGIDGYVMMSRNKDNQCGIANYCTYPLV